MVALSSNNHKSACKCLIVYGDICGGIWREGEAQNLEGFTDPSDVDSDMVHRFKAEFGPFGWQNKEKKISVFVPIFPQQGYFIKKFSGQYICIVIMCNSCKPVKKMIENKPTNARRNKITNIFVLLFLYISIHES